MSATLQPFGLKPIRHLNGKFVPPPRAIPGGIASAYGTAIYSGDPVIMATTGVLQIGGSSGDLYGVFAGCAFTPSNVGLFTPSMSWPASQAYISDNQMYAYVYEDPGIIYEIQCAGSLVQTSVGDQANVTNIATGNNGQSVVELSSSLAGAGSQAQFRIVGLSERIGNAWGDAFTIVEVMLAQSQYVSNKVAI